MFFVGERLDHRGSILLIYSSFSPILLNVGEFVNGKGVFFIKGGSVELFCSCDCLFWGLVFDERKSGKYLETGQPLSQGDLAYPSD